MSKKVIIVGAVAAGPKAACRLKRLHPDWDILLLDQDSLISYGGCGIPYFVGGDVSDESELRSTSFHMIRDEGFFERAKGLRVRTQTKALAIDREKKQLRVRDLKSGQEEDLSYDTLLLATGAQPIEPPIPGMHLDGVYTISDLHKAIAIKKRVASGKVGKVVVIGGGAIGIEMAENFADLWGLETTLVEMAPGLLPGAVDWPFAAMLKHHLEEKGVCVYTGEAARAILDNGEGAVAGVKTSEREIEGDMVIMAVGVKPRSALAREAGLNLTVRGAIRVNERLQTSDPDIYAAGDCVSTINLVTGREGFAPLGSLANRQGRVAGDNIGGIPSRFQGTLGSFIMKAFERCVGSVGLTCEAARREGFDADYAIVPPSDRAHFFPGQSVVILQLVFDRRSRRVLGLQAFGQMNDFIQARIDAAAALIATGGVIEDFGMVEMAYAPPFSAAIDAINAAAYVADNLCAGRLRKVGLKRFLQWMEDMDSENWYALDLRHAKDSVPYVERYGEKHWLALPYDQVREKYACLPQDKTGILLCNAGPRSYEVQIFLDSLGLTNTLVLCGGLNLIRRMGVSWYMG